MDGVALIKSEPGLTLPSDDEDLDAELEHLQALIFDEKMDFNHNC